LHTQPAEGVGELLRAAVELAVGAALDRQVRPAPDDLGLAEVPARPIEEVQERERDLHHQSVHGASSGKWKCRNLSLLKCRSSWVRCATLFWRASCNSRWSWPPPCPPPLLPRSRSTRSSPATSRREEARRSSLPCRI